MHPLCQNMILQELSEVLSKKGPSKAQLYYANNPSSLSPCDTHTEIRKKTSTLEEEGFDRERETE